MVQHMFQPLLLLLLPQGFKIFGDGVWFKTNAAAMTPEGANILGLGFGLGNNLPFLFVSTVSTCCCSYLFCSVLLLLFRMLWDWNSAWATTCDSSVSQQ